MILASPTFTWQEEGSVQLSRVTMAARQEQGVLVQPPQVRGVCRRSPQANWQGSSWNEAKARAQLPAADPERGQPVLQCCGLCPAAHHRGTQSCSEPEGSGTFPTPCLCGVIKHGTYFHLQQGSWHCCGQVLKSVPRF